MDSPLFKAKIPKLAAPSAEIKPQITIDLIAFIHLHPPLQYFDIVHCSELYHPLKYLYNMLIIMIIRYLSKSTIIYKT